MKPIAKASLVILSLLFIFSLQAGVKKNDQQLEIVTDQQGCAKAVVLISSQDNCASSQFAANCGKNGKDCVCMQRQKFLSWTITNGARFELEFIGANPLKSNCSLKSGNNAKMRCKVKGTDGEYEYNVIVDGCPGQVYDPKIVVRGGGTQ